MRFFLPIQLKGSRIGNIFFFKKFVQVLSLYYFYIISILSLYYLYIIFIPQKLSLYYLYIIFILSLYYLYTSLYYLYTEILSQAFSANSVTLHPHFTPLILERKYNESPTSKCDSCLLT